MIDLLKFEKPAQFPKDEILNDKDRIVRAWMSAEVRDKEGDIIPVSELKRVLNTWFKRGATMMDQHTNRPIGRGLKWEEGVHPENNTPAIKLDYQVYDDYTVDNDVWDEIKQGKRTGLSIGGRATGVPEIKYDINTGETGKKLSGLELYEVSPVDNPANQLAENIAINYLAKGVVSDPIDFEKKLMQDFKKGFEGDPNKPFGGFGDMDGCMAGQKKRGHSEESSQRICTFLQHRTNQQFQKGTLENKDGQIARVKIKSQDIQKPFSEYKNFEDCVRQNQDAKNPEAYCASIEHVATGKWPAEKQSEKQSGPGGHVRDNTGPHGAGAGPGKGTGDCDKDTIKGWPVNFVKSLEKPKRLNSA